MKKLFIKLWQKYVEIWRNSYIFRTLASSAMASVVGLFFIVFNGALGIIYHSLWHGTICIYYILLTLVRVIIVACQREEKHRHELEGGSFRRKVSLVTHILLFVLNVALIVPIAIMINGDREYDYGLVPAIAMAAYTTYRIVMSILNLKKAKEEKNCLVRELRVINMVDTLVAILSLQNAMIIASGGSRIGMQPVTIGSSTVIFVLIVGITARSMVVNR